MKLQSESKANPGWNFNNSYTGLPDIFYTRIDPIAVRDPKLVVWNETLATLLGLNGSILREKTGAEIFSGNLIPEGAEPIAQAYAGHQFGQFTILGDGRAILLGEQITPSGARMDIQLKGSGETPYSRRGDGRAALGPMLREYIISEAMHGLGIPTSRSLAVVTTGESVLRERRFPGAILTRVASSHIRVGTFEFAAARGTKDELRSLADYTIDRHFPESRSAEHIYLDFLRQVVSKQAKLIAQWQMVGFIHGVMNTDNMALSGETIDYGPCAFMDAYDPKTVFSSIDRQGRYSYGNQPFIAQWNLARFAETLLPLLHSDQEKALQLAQEELTGFVAVYEKHWMTGMRSKLGLFNEENEDTMLIHDLLGILQQNQIDFTNAFLTLTQGTWKDSELGRMPEFEQWKHRWETRRQMQELTMEESHRLMSRSNPVVIPRNHKVEEALAAATDHNDYDVMVRLVKVLSRPFESLEGSEDYTTPAPPSAKPYRTFCGT
ncbi:MAG: YdiU family protein [Firmicutes bacterium HGW-Firmicutes-11]|jgi:uncharacterized protein YdiU (UPF0061 family)|nr:MAG: YdiU family protein [Firmicutes bacterium HGW-Firmicutes-11]